MSEIDELKKTIVNLARKMAILRGEAMGAHILATHAILELVQRDPNPVAAYNIIAEHTDRMLSSITFGPASSPSSPDGDELNILTVESARTSCDQVLSAIRAAFDS